MTTTVDQPPRFIPASVYPLLAAALALILAALDVSRLSGLWPCDIACQGGAHYQRLAGISVIWPALAVHLLLAGLAWRDHRRGGWCPWSVRLVWFTAGVSLFFALVARELGLACAYCIAIHGGTLLLLGLVTPFPRTVRWWHAVAWLVAGWLVANAAFHHRVVTDVAAGGPVVADGADLAVIERGRSYGDAKARQHLELVIDLTCRHCAEQYRPLMEALKPQIAATRVQVVVRHLVRPSQPASRPAARLALAAAALGEHATGMEVLLGSNPDSGAAGLQARLAEVIDPGRLDAVLARDGAAIDALLAQDQQEITRLGTGAQTPAAVLSEGGSVVKRWGGKLPVADILAALDSGL